MTLSVIVPDRIWCAQQPLRFGPLHISTRMTAVRLADGGLWIHSPIAPTPALVRDLSGLGRPRFVVAPNRSHHLFFLPFLDAWTDARGWVAAGLKAKRPDLATFPELTGSMPWDDELEPHFVRGLPILDETVWFHRATGTLIVADLLFSFSRANPWPERLAARALGVLDGLGMSRTMKLAVRDRDALRESVQPLVSMPIERIVLAHDQVVTDRARERLQRAFDWLG